MFNRQQMIDISPLLRNLFIILANTITDYPDVIPEGVQARSLTNERRPALYPRSANYPDSFVTLFAR